MLAGIEHGDEVRCSISAGGLDLAAKPQDGGAVARERGGRILSATPTSRRCRALKTMPMPPWPSLSRTR